MIKFCKVTKLLLIMLPAIIWSYLTWLFRYSRHPEKYPIEKRYAKFHRLMLKVTKHCHADMMIEGLEHLEKLKEGSLIAANHLSVMDIVLIGSLSKRPISFIAKKEAKKIPFVGRCIRVIDGQFLDRHDARQAVRCFQKAQELAKIDKISYVIYPEGTRNKNPYTSGVAEFHAGSFRLALRNQKDLLLMCQFGTQRILSNDSHFSSNPIQITFKTPLFYEKLKDLSTTDIAEKAHEIVDKEFETMKLKDKKYIDELRYKKKAPKWWKEFI